MCTAWNTIAAVSIAADAKPSCGPEAKIFCHHRGSNTLSETKAIRRGGSSSCMHKTAERVALKAASSS